MAGCQAQDENLNDCVVYITEKIGSRKLEDRKRLIKDECACIHTLLYIYFQ